MGILRQHVTALMVAMLVLLGFAQCRSARSQDQERQPPTRSANATCRRTAFRVVIDVGHTIGVPGALSARGVPEYKFNLDLAQDIYQALVGDGFDNSALLLTNEPPPYGLFVRANRANALQADLFIAIHHDSVPDNLLETWQFNGQQNRFNDQYPGYAIFISSENADSAGSLLFGKLLGEALEARDMRYTPHYTLPLMGHRQRKLVDAKAGVYRYDQLIVLRQTHMPAVLLEAGSIVNRQEELDLATSERRARISAAVTAAVEDFCAARQRPKIDRVVKHASP